MQNESIEVERPERWDHPLDPNMSDEIVSQLLQFPPFSKMDSKKFASHLSLAGVLKNDARLVTYQEGDFIFQEGQYGATAYLVLGGNVRIVLDRLVAGSASLRRGWTGMQWLSFFRKSERKKDNRPVVNIDYSSRGSGRETRLYLQDIPRLVTQHATSQVTAGEMFGEIAAVNRTPREFTAVAETECKVLEIRWQGLKLLKQDPSFRALLDDQYRGDLLSGELRALDLFRFIPDEEFERVVASAKIESFGNLEWFADYRKRASKPAREQIEAEPLVCEEGQYVTGLWIIRSGFARLSRRQGAGHRTLAYLGKGQIFGLKELAHNHHAAGDGKPLPYQESLRAIGHVDAICIPKAEVLRYILPYVRRSDLPPPITNPHYEFGQPIVDAPLEAALGQVETGLLEFLVEKRLMNGREAMVIDMHRCTRCDDCVTACANTHGGTPVFERHGPQYGKWMIAQACMHCEDPVCMIGCPTGAIHRNHETGMVDINSSTCIGCKTCAESCPYENIKMVGAKDQKGRAKVDEKTGLPILQASKCDFCADAGGRPSCQAACPHDALYRFDLSSISDVQNLMGGNSS